MFIIFGKDYVVLEIVFIKRHSCAIGKLKHGGTWCLFGEFVDAFDDFRGHGHGCPMIAIESATCRQTEKIVTTLFVSGGTKGESSNRASLHAVVVWFVCLDVLSKLKLDVVVVVDGRTDNNCAWTHRVGDATACRKTVQPKAAVVYELDDHTGRNGFERQHVDNAACTFLNDAYVTLDFGDVFVRGNGV